MRRVVVGSRQINEAAHRLAQARCLDLCGRLHGCTFGVQISFVLGRSVRRYGSIQAAVPGLHPSAHDGTSSDGAVVTHPMSLEDLAPFPNLDKRKTQRKPQQAALPIISPEMYGKWRSLSLNNDLLQTESDFNSPGPQGGFLVDQPENGNDVVLWTTLLRFRCQRMGRDGAAMIWQAIDKRRKLYEIHGVVAVAFWQAILNNAVHDYTFLESVWLYAEWLFETHGTKVPELYTTIMSFLLAQEKFQEAKQWHIRLSPNFDPGRDAFAALLKRFIVQPDVQLTETLRNLYNFSHHRNLYDDLVPYLFGQGLSDLANQWRRHLVRWGDVPATALSGPFLRYFAAYYPRKFPGHEMTKEELSVAGLGTDESLDRVEVEDNSFAYFVNRVHGETFGIQEKKLNDSMGAKWFASEWVSLDFAISAVHALGIHNIGPRSLQSIALRENSAAGILRRIAQLHQLRIGIGTYYYSSAIRYLARMDDYETLRELLLSDIHPDVFGNERWQKSVYNSCLVDGDWKKARLLNVANLAASIDSVQNLSNELLKACIVDDNKEMILQVLSDMISRGVDIFPSSSHLLSMHMTTHLNKDEAHEDLDLDYVMNLSRQLAATQFPPASIVWETLITRLGQMGRIDELETLSLEIMRMYNSWSESESPLIAIHKNDVPEVYKRGSPYKHFQLLPRDFPIRSELGPVLNIFQPKNQLLIIWWSFNSMLTRVPSVAASKTARNQPSDFHLARSVRLLRIMKDLGLRVHPAQIRKAVLWCLADYYARAVRDPKWSRYSDRLMDMMDLAEVKWLFDNAWGEELLPHVSEIGEFVASKGRSRIHGELDFLDHMKPQGHRLQVTRPKHRRSHR